MMAGPSLLDPGPLPGTRLGHTPGVVLLLCQCCRQRPQILAETRDGKLIIQSKRSGERHYVVLGTDISERLDADGKIWCACCDPETDHGRILAECRDGLLLIRAIRHQRPHFVALGAQRLQRLLALGDRTA